MNTTSERWLPKVHPASRELEAEDPMELMANPVQGDPDLMLQCLLQEYAWMGWDADQILALFHNPAYPVPQQLLELVGEAMVRQRVQEVVGQAGVVGFREFIDDEPEPDEEHEPVLIQLSTRKLAPVPG
jgi:hypothetical protein